LGLQVNTRISKLKFMDMCWESL